MEIALTYDPRWRYTPQGRTPFWASLDTVEYVSVLLEELGMTVLALKADDAFETRLADIKHKHARPLVFWLNEFIPTASGRDMFTVRVIEKLGMMHTGPGPEALATGLDKRATKEVFRRLGLPTPESYVVSLSDFSPIYEHAAWEGYAIVKPLLQGNSRGMDGSSVVPAGDAITIREKVERVHREFTEPALVERYIGGEKAREFTVPMLISHDGGIAELPITEIDLSQIPLAQGRFRFLTHDIKDEKYYLKIPADLPSDRTRSIYLDVARIIHEVGLTDMTRVDLRADATGLYYLEVNANPGKNRFSYLTTSAYSLGLQYGALIAFIPYQAMLKYHMRPPRRLEQLVQPVMALFDRSRQLTRPRTGKRAVLYGRPVQHRHPGL